MNKKTSSANELEYQSLPPIVQAIGAIKIVGNIIPSNWYKHIRTDANKPDLIGVTILAEIINWFQPLIMEDEKTGDEIYKKRFAADKLQTDISYYINKFGLGKDQVKKALIRLEKNGCITKELRNIKHGKKTLNNRLFVEPIPEKILEITFTKKDYQKNNTTSANSHYPSCEINPSANSHHPSCEIAPHTITPNTLTSVFTEKDDRQEKSDNPIAKTDPENWRQSSSVLNFNFDDFEWPSRLEKKPSNLQILARLENNNVRQQVLDVYAQKSQKEEIRNPAGLLNKLTNNKIKDDFTPVAKTESKSNIPTKQSINRQEVEEQRSNQDRQAKIQNCPYCDDKGMIIFETENGDTHQRICTHHRIDQLDKGYVKILTLREDIEQPKIAKSKPFQYNGNWINIVDQLDLIGSTKAFARNSILNKEGNNWKINSGGQNLPRKKERQDEITQAIKKKFGSDQNVYWDHKDLSSLMQSEQNSIDSCPYCDHNGVLIIKDKLQDQWKSKCNHDERTISAKAISDAGYEYTEVITAKEGYKNPWHDKPRSFSDLLNNNNDSKENTSLLNNDQNNQQDNQEVDHQVLECPYCDDNGTVEILGQFHGQVSKISCRHPDPSSSKVWAWEIVKEILSAREGYRTQDDHKKYQLNDDDEVPF